MDRSQMHKPSKHRCQNRSKMGGAGASLLGASGVILDLFWGSGRILAPKRVLGGVWGGSWTILDAEMVPTWNPRWGPTWS